MSVIVKGMELPTECRECPLWEYRQRIGTTWCVPTKTLLAENYMPIAFEGRHPDCPLVEMNDDDGWIPTSKRLPEENGEYLVTRESVFYRYIDIVRKSNCNSDLPMASDIKAWMPIPKPYQQRRKHNERN